MPRLSLVVFLIAFGAVAHSCASKQSRLGPRPGELSHLNADPRLPQSVASHPPLPKDIVALVTITHGIKKFTPAGVVEALNSVLSIGGRKVRLAQVGEKPNLKLELQPQAMPEQYRLFGTGAPRTLYAGARVAAAVTVGDGPTTAVVSVLIPPFSASMSRTQPEDAPFMDALYVRGGLVEMLIALLARHDGEPVLAKALAHPHADVRRAAIRYIAHAKPRGGPELLVASLPGQVDASLCGDLAGALHLLDARDQAVNLVRTAVNADRCAYEVIRLVGRWDHHPAIVASSLFFRAGRRPLDIRSYYFAIAAEGIKDVRLVPALAEILKDFRGKKPIGLDRITVVRSMDTLEELTGANPGDTAESWLIWWEANQSKYPFGELEAMLQPMAR